VIESLAYCAPLVYSPRGESGVAKQSRVLRDAIKAGDKQLIPAIAQHVSQLVSAGHFAGFFGDDVTLVPVPKSAPMRAGTLWVPLMIAQALKEAGLARDVWPCLVRVKAIQKSAWAGPGERPGVAAHIDSLLMDSIIPPTSRILLVDDFVTKGRTLFATAVKITEALPSIEARGFAFIRTMGLVNDITTIKQPVTGEIRSLGNDVNRQP